MFFLADSKLPECDVFIQYYSQIVNNMSAKSLCPYFVAKNIILPEHQEEIMSTTSSKRSAMLLLRTISCALETGIVEGFYKFLEIIEQHGNVDSKNVVLAIRRKLSKEFGQVEKFSSQNTPGINYAVEMLL